MTQALMFGALVIIIVAIVFLFGYRKMAPLTGEAHSYGIRKKEWKTVMNHSQMLDTRTPPRAAIGGDVAPDNGDRA